MPLPDTAFRHLPHLKDRIADPDTSFFRNLDITEFDRRVRAAGGPDDWRHPCSRREALRRAVLAGREGQDIWVFAYGSLMWDPAIHFDELRRAHAPDHVRSFCLWDKYARGSIEVPGLMAALDRGAGCTGYALHIPAAQVEEETTQLCRRELIGPAYRAEFISCTTRQGPIEALTFTADHGSETIVSGLSIDTQARMLATATGFLGPNADYLENLAHHLEEMNIADPYIADLLARVRALKAARAE